MSSSGAELTKDHSGPLGQVSAGVVEGVSQPARLAIAVMYLGVVMNVSSDIRVVHLVVCQILSLAHGLNRVCCSCPTG